MWKVIEDVLRTIAGIVLANVTLLAIVAVMGAAVWVVDRIVNWIRRK